MRLTAPLSSFILITSSLCWTGCGKSSVAQTSFGFTPTSAVSQLDEQTSFIGVEAVLPRTPPLASFDFPFQLPAQRRVVKLQGTSSFRTACSNGQYLAVITIDQMKYALNDKAPYGGGSVSHFVSYEVPYDYSLGLGNIHIEADPDCFDPARPTTWEFQGLLRIE